MPEQLATGKDEAGSSLKGTDDGRALFGRDDNSETWLRVSALLQIARHAGKRIVRVSTDQTHCADDKHENNG
jgi:hypothetical protein